MNSITIAGQLGKDAELRHLANGDAVVSFSIADSGQGKNNPPIWWSASFFGKRAEGVQPYLTKGQAVTISGSVSEREWTDKDGQKRRSMDVRVNDLALQGGKRDESQKQSSPQRQAAAREPKTGFDDMDDSIPF